MKRYDGIMYTYKATVGRVIDGDTLEMRIDLGFDVSFNATLRMLGINAPEMKGPTKPAGLASKDELERLLSLAASFVIRTEKPLKTDKYGRYLASITAVNHNGAESSVNDAMVNGGFAVPFMV